MDEEKKEIEKKEISSKIDLTKKLRENPWILSTFVLGIMMLILLIGNLSGGITGNAISSNDAGNALMELAKAQIGDIEILNVEKESGLYNIFYSSSQGNGSVYMTLDGKNLANLMPIEMQDSSSNDQKKQDIPKSDKPSVELFVMTHCPYGTQAEKGIIPTIKTLDENADIKIRFVHYFMHEPEKTETPRQVCIREEQSDKYLDYLECFLEDGDSDRCLTKAGIDKTKMNECISSGKSDEYYKKDSELSEGYGVSGSPTLVINGQITSSGRDSASYLNAICQAFNNSPEKCDSKLSSASPSPGFGWGETGSSTTAQC